VTKPDDYSLPPQSILEIKKQADRLLKQADAYGRFPTPISDLVAAANLTVSKEASLEEDFLSRLYRQVRAPIKFALEKVLGLLDARDRTIYLDQSVHEKKKPFLTLHEAGHNYLPWQRDLFAILEDGESSLDPEIREQFEREANAFAIEVIFQLDRFGNDASAHEIGIKVPINLAKQYGSSVYTAVRRYVTTNSRACAVLVLNPPEFDHNIGYTASLRRALQSEKFTERFGTYQWPESFGPESQLISHLPIGRKFVSPSACELQSLEGEIVPCIFEGFNSTYQIFVLIYPESELQNLVI